MSRPAPSAFTGLIDLASAAIGGRALASSDDFFASVDNLVKPEPAHFDPTTYTDRGKEMDGWESRRRRTPGHDWAILELGVPGRIRAVDIDTAHFLGNHAPFASLQAVFAPAASAEWLRDRAEWTSVVAQTPMRPGSQNLCASTSDAVFTHVRLNMYPDGGIARLRLYGDPEPERPDGRFDLAALVNGGRAVACSDAFFSPMEQLIHPGKSTFMGGGWETRRSRPRGADWIVVRLAQPGMVERLEVDTHHFKGNFPDELAIDGLYWPDASPTALRDSTDWTELVPLEPMAADCERAWDLAVSQPWTHLRVRIVPDGGIARLRAFGRATERTPSIGDAGLSALNALESKAAAKSLEAVCGSSRWVAAMVAARPFPSRTALFGTAESLWWHLEETDWREAFSHHPKIGSAAASGWAATEQAGMRDAAEQVAAELAAANTEYQARRGYIFIVCATGLSADEMLDRLRRRLDNPPPKELRIAAGEQAKITRLRLEKLLLDSE